MTTTGEDTDDNHGGKTLMTTTGEDTDDNHGGKTLMKTMGGGRRITRGVHEKRYPRMGNQKEKLLVA